MLKSIFPVSVITFMSRILGLIREMLLYTYIGAGAKLDIFLIAFRLPNLTRRFFAEGSFNQAMLPELTSVAKKNNISEYQQFISQCWIFLTFAIGLFCLLIWLFPYAWIHLLAPGINQIYHDELANAIKVTAPYAYCMTMVAFYGTIMQVHQHYALSAFSPIILNIALVLVLFFAQKNTSPLFLCQTVAIAGFMQFTLQYVYGRHFAKISILKLQRPKPYFYTMLRNFVKLSLSGILIQGNMLIDQIFLSWMPSGTISEYNICERLTELPLGVIIYSIAIVFTGQYARHYENSFHRVSLQIKAVILTFAMVLPCVIGLITLKEPILSMFLTPGESSFIRTSHLIVYFSYCLIPMALNKIYTTMAAVERKANLVIAVHIIGSAVNLALDFLLYKPYGSVGILMATLSTLIVQVSIYEYHFALLRKFARLPKRLSIQLMMALLALLASCYYAQNLALDDSKIYMIIKMLVSVSIIALGYIGLLYPLFKYLESKKAF